MSERSAPSGDGAAHGRDRHAKLHKAERIVAEELRSYLVAFLYIWVLLGMFTLHEEIALRSHGGVTAAFPFLPHGFAVVNALVLGKVALIVEDLRLGARIRAAPLIWPILCEACILSILFIAMHLAESVIGGWIQGEALAASVPAVGGGGLAGMTFAALSFFVAMIPYCAFRRIGAAIGWDRMRALLFGPVAPPPGTGA